MRWALAIGLSLAFLIGPAVLDSYLEDRVEQLAYQRIEHRKERMCIQAVRTDRVRCYWIFLGEEK